MDGVFIFHVYAASGSNMYLLTSNEGSDDDTASIADIVSGAAAANGVSFAACVNICIISVFCIVVYGIGMANGLSLAACVSICILPLLHAANRSNYAFVPQNME